MTWVFLMLRIVTLIATATLPDVLYIPLTIALLCMRVFELLYVLICVNCGIRCDMLNNGVFFPPRPIAPTHKYCLHLTMSTIIICNDCAYGMIVKE